MVQEAYHQVRGNALWPSTFCWPEGFMRRWYPAAVWEHYVIATPDLVHVRAGVARNFIQDTYIGREFNMEDVPKGGVPRLGAAVPRWYGETIGFWDKDTLITWTSNIQGWKSHSEFEFSSKMQSIEIYTPMREAGKFVGLNHETILYDEEALATPVRIVRNLNKINNFTDTNEVPYPFIECVQTIFNVNGIEHAADTGLEARVRDARHVRPAVGEDLGGELRARHDRARGQLRRPVQLRELDNVRRLSSISGAIQGDAMAMKINWKLSAVADRASRWPHRWRRSKARRSTSRAWGAARPSWSMRRLCPWSARCTKAARPRR